MTIKHNDIEQEERTHDKRYDCKYPDCTHGTNQSHRTCLYHKAREAKQRQIEKAKNKQAELNTMYIETEAKENNEITQSDIENYSRFQNPEKRKKKKKNRIKNGIYQYSKAEKEQYNENKKALPRCCEGCLRIDNIPTPSHRVPQAENRTLFADRNNLDAMCIKCHHKVENFKLLELRNGKEIIIYIYNADRDYFNRRLGQQNEQDYKGILQVIKEYNLTK